MGQFTKEYNGFLACPDTGTKLDTGKTRLFPQFANRGLLPRLARIDPASRSDPESPVPFHRKKQADLVPLVEQDHPGTAPDLQTWFGTPPYRITLTCHPSPSEP